MNSVIHRPADTLIRTSSASADEVLLDVLWLRELRSLDKLLVRLPELAAACLGRAMTTTAAATPLLGVWLALHTGSYLTRRTGSTLLLAGAILSGAGLAASVLLASFCRYARNRLRLRGRFQPIRGSKWRHPAYPDELWCGRYAELDGKLAFYLEFWTHDGSWHRETVGPPERADPEDAVAMGEARARIERRAIIEHARLQAMRLERDLLDDRRRTALAMAQKLAS